VCVCVCLSMCDDGRVWDDIQGILVCVCVCVFVYV